MNGECEICGEDAPLGAVRMTGTKFRRTLELCRPCRCRLSDAVERHVDTGGEPDVVTRYVERTVPVDRVVRVREIAPGVPAWRVYAAAAIGVAAGWTIRLLLV